MPEWGAALDLDALDSADRAVLIEIIRVYRERWVIVGPCLDSGWYACPRHDETLQRVNVASLPSSTPNQGSAKAPPETAARQALSPAHSRTGRAAPSTVPARPFDLTLRIARI
jgi:hypothetical protein